MLFMLTCTMFIVILFLKMVSIDWYNPHKWKVLGSSIIFKPCASN